MPDNYQLDINIAKNSKLFQKFLKSKGETLNNLSQTEH